MLRQVLGELEKQPAKFVGKFLTEVGNRLQQGLPTETQAASPQEPGKEPVDAGDQNPGSGPIAELTPEGRAMLEGPRQSALARKAAFLARHGIRTTESDK